MGSGQSAERKISRQLTTDFRKTLDAPSPLCFGFEKGKFVVRGESSETLFGEGLSLSRRPVLVQDLACRDSKEVEHALLPYPAL